MKKFATCAAALALCVMALALVNARADQEKSQTIKGTLTQNIAEDAKSMKLTDISDSDKIYTMNLSKTTKVKLDNEPGTLSDLKKGDRLQCICTKTETANTYDCSEIRRNKKDQKNSE